jgi:DNA-binding NarL/FixJ family response regulator
MSSTELDHLAPATSEPACVTLVDDHPLLAAGLRIELERRGARVDVIGVPDSSVDVVRRVLDSRPHCVVVDLGLPIEGGGQAVIAALVAEGLRVAVLTGETERWQWAQAVHNGAAVVLSKAEELTIIVETVLRLAGGEQVRPVERATLSSEYVTSERDRRQRLEPFTRLSPREEMVLALLTVGRSPKQIADEHAVSIETIRSHIKSLLRKLDCGSQLEAVAAANAAGWTPPNSTGD